MGATRSVWSARKAYAHSASRPVASAPEWNNDPVMMEVMAYIVMAYIVMACE